MLIYLATYSRFYDTAPLLFYAGLGLFQTYVAGLLNIASTAQISFPYLYWEPLVYAALLIADATHFIASDSTLIALYTLLILIVFIKYSMFMYAMITQLTKYLGIRLLRVKDKGTKKN